jgi:hypothetical protein
MLILRKNTANTVIVTVTEATTIDNAKYLFDFLNVTSNTKAYCIATNISNQKQRYDKFIITEKTNPNNLIGEIALEHEGDYYYKIYEQSSSTNLDPTGLKLVEQGIAKIYNSEQQTTIIADSYEATQNI